MSILGRFAQNQYFRWTYTGLAVVFVILAPFISLKPDQFSKFGYLGVVVFNVLGSGLLIIGTLVHKMNWVLLILCCGLGNMVNTSINFLVGKSSQTMFHKLSVMDRIKKLMQKFQSAVIFILAVIPLPIDLNGLLAGYLNINYPKYLLINFLGKLTTFFLVATLSIWFGR